jgi:hypothetical protein
MWERAIRETLVHTYTHLNVQVSRRERTGIRRKKLSPLALYVSARKRYCRALKGHDIKGTTAKIRIAAVQSATGSDYKPP